MEGEFSGGCHCGQVRYLIKGRVLNGVNCHCSICRKANGGAFSSYLVVPEEAFEIVLGQDLLTRYALSEEGEKHFCRICGSAVFNRNQRYPGVTIVHLGSLDAVETFSPTINMFCESRLPWVVFSDGSLCYEKGITK
jgi:hypothetical protein